MELFSLESPDLKVDVTLLGGRVWSLTQKRSAKQWLWHNPQWEKCNVKPGANYDEHWIGGWDDLFPNDAKGQWQGLELPDHGELWSATWTLVEMIKNRSITLSYSGQTFPYQLTKTLTLQGSKLLVHYRLVNLTPQSFDLLFKLHPAFAVGPGDRFEISGGKVEPVSLDFSTLIQSPGPFSWPHGDGKAGQTVDLSVVPNTSEKEFVYIRELQSGRFGILDTQGNRLEMSYPQSIFPYLWIFADYGAWQGYQVAVLEPCTNYPKDLAQASSMGTCLKLLPQQNLEFDISLQVF